ALELVRRHGHAPLALEERIAPPAAGGAAGVAAEDGPVEGAGIQRTRGLGHGGALQLLLEPLRANLLVPDAQALARELGRQTLPGRLRGRGIGPVADLAERQGRLEER